MMHFVGQPVHILTDQFDLNLLKLKKIFMISDDQITIEVGPEMSQDRDSENLFYSDSITDFGKLCNPYFFVNTINVLNQILPVRLIGDDKRKFIVVPCYKNYDDLQKYKINTPEQNSVWPFYRYYSLDQYMQLVKLIKDAGYEVIIMDSENISLEQKVYILNELCTCVIGYEGGLQHLAHLLKIPCIILPWTENHNEQHWAKPHFLHVDERTWFAESIDSVLSWTPDKLRIMIHKLYNGGGNGGFLHYPRRIRTDLMEIILNINGVDRTANPYLGTLDKDLIQSYIRPNMYDNGIVFYDQNSP